MALNLAPTMNLTARASEVSENYLSHARHRRRRPSGKLDRLHHEISELHKALIALDIIQQIPSWPTRQAIHSPETAAVAIEPTLEKLHALVEEVSLCLSARRPHCHPRLTPRMKAYEATRYIGELAAFRRFLQEFLHWHSVCVHACAT